MSNKIHLLEDEKQNSRHEQFKLFSQKAGEFFDVQGTAEILKIPASEATKVLSR